VRPLVREHGLQLADLTRFLALRQELFEVDVRFGQLGPRSVFEALDASGVLDHSVPGVDRIDEAIEQPPKHGRAHLRGEMIRQAVTTAQRYSCSWEFVIDQTEAYLDLLDPFAERPTWKMPTQPTPSPAAPARPRERRASPASQTPPQRSPLPWNTEEDDRLFFRLLARIRGTRHEASRDHQ
jgi:hypothetical protein